MQPGHYSIRRCLSSGELTGVREVREENEEIYNLETEELVDSPSDWQGNEDHLMRVLAEAVDGLHLWIKD
jgi:hypothetical protein